ncbi:RsmB/NOP family class I SAM-dependent RNA methyltransferase [Kordiimonas aquimaris]|uniref:RsmB/NOP family class I SAM-dependent RNA methyltransferase n=1 Tax=Kordiimonas aquimaris TaxID=707591 RepID=UPI0021D1EBE4|nr:RsmB/NOP family class I SAM-dependent RNA methyltransferase [Kordiimonas aquimaris]
MIKGRMNTHQKQTLDTPRIVAVRSLMAVTLKARPFDLSLNEMAQEAGLNARDRAFAFNLVMLSLRQLGGLRSLMNSLVERGIPFEAKWTEAALVTGLAQILLMRTADYAAVNETVDMIKNLSGKEKGFAGLVNAVLRRAVKEREKLTEQLAATPETNLPEWLHKGWEATYGMDTMRAIACSLATTPPLDITLKPDENVDEWAKALNAKKLPTGSLRLDSADVPKLPGYEDGKWWVQDMAAAIPAKLLGDIKGKYVLDLCAAPGGKTMQLAAAGGNVVSIDRSKNRLRRLTENLSRTKLEATVINADAAKFEPQQSVDHILLDAPCSATGTLRRNPDVLWTKGPQDVAKLADLQSRILAHAFSLLPVGGTLVYCVCSLEACEGVEQITRFLDAESSAKRIPIVAEEVGDMVELITTEGDLLCLPSHYADQGGMDGFFVARLTRT